MSLLLFATLVFSAPIGKITLVQGRVDVLKTGRNVATPVSLGAAVDPGDVYRAKSNGRAEITFTNKNLMRIAPGTRIEITRYSVEGDKSSTVARLYRGRVQAIGADDFIKRAASFAEGNRFEVHTPNAVAGIRGTNMVVFFEKGATGALFVSGRGYLYNPQRPRQIVLIVAGTISFISAPGATPTPPRKMTDAETAMYTQLFAGGSSGGGDTMPSEFALVSGGGGGPPSGGGGGPQSTISPPPPPELPGQQTAIEGPFYSSFNTDIWKTGSGLLWKGEMAGAFEGNDSLWSGDPPLVTISGTYTNSATGTAIWSSKVSSTADPYSYTHPMWSWNEDTMTATTSDGGSYVGFAGGADYNGILEGRFIGLYIDPSKNAGTLSAPVSGIYSDGIFTMLGSISRTFKGAVSIDPVDFEANDTQDGIPLSYISGVFPATYGTMSGSFGGTILSIDDEPWGIYFFRAGGAYSLPAPSWNAKIGGYTKFGAYYNASSVLYHDNAYWIGNITNGSWGDDKITAVLNGQYVSERRMGSITGDVIGTHNSGTSGNWQAVSLGTWTGVPLAFGNPVSPDLLYYDPSSGWQTDGSFDGNMGGTSSIWSSSQSGPASFKIIGQYNTLPAGTRALIWNDGNYSMNNIYNGLPDFYTTYDGGSYDMNIGAVITADGDIYGRFTGIYIDPYGHAGLLRGGLTGTSYPDIGMLEVDGSTYRIEKESTVYLTPDQLKDAMEYHGPAAVRTTRLAGTSPAGGVITGSTTDTFGNTFASFIDEANKITYPWGYYTHTLGGSYTGTISTWTGKTGGFHYLGNYYDTPTTHTGSPAYWLADITSGTWTNGTFGGTASGTFISATAMGTISGDVIGTYDADTTWASRSSGTSSAISGITFGKNTFVATGFSGAVLTSSDGITWTPQTSGTASNLFEVIYGNGQFVTAGVSGTILTSSDGITWTPQTSGTTNNLFGITYGNNRFVAVGGLVTLASSDGITWTLQNPGVSLYGVAYGNNKFVTIGLSGAILTSSDGITWTPQTSGTTDNLLGVAYGNNRFVAAGVSGAILTSSDGITWTPQTSGTSTALSYVFYGNGAFIAVGDSGAILTSSDGITWTPQTSGTTDNLLGVLCAKNKFVAVGNSGTILDGSNPWQAASVGVWEGTPIGFVSNIPSGIPLSFFDGTSFGNDGSINGGMMGGITSLWTATQEAPAPVKIIGAYTDGENNAHIWGFTIVKGGVSSPTINISLLPADWIEDTTYGWVSDNYYKETTGTGSLRVVRTAVGGGFGGGVNLRTDGTYNFQDSIFRYKWRMNGQGSYAATWNGPGAGFWGLGGNITTGWSYAGSLLVDSDQWIYTELQINSDLSYTVDLSYTGYGLGGIYHTAGTLAQSSYDALNNTWFRHRIVDNYANGAYFEIAEAMINNYYNDGNYKGYLTGIDLNNSLEARMIALYIDPSGKAGYLKGSFTGTAYPEISMFEMDGSIYPVQKNAAIGINPDNLGASVRESSGSTGMLAGTLGSGSITSTEVSFETMALINSASHVAQNWGIYKLTGYGSFSNPGSATTWTGRTGGEDTFGAYYSDDFNDDHGRWIATITDGTWTGDKLTGTLSGEFITMTKMGTLSGELLGTYYNYSSQDLWQAVSVGAWEGTPLKFASSIDAFRYNLQTTGALTAGTMAATGNTPWSVAIDPTGKFAYVANKGSNTVSVYIISQTTGALTAGAPAATETSPTSVAVDPTGRFAYVANYNSNTVSVYAINQSTGALTAGTAVATGSFPNFVSVDPTGRFAYVTNKSSNTVSVYIINQSTGALTAGTPATTGSSPWSVAVDPTGKFAYVANYASSTVSVYAINQTTGELTAGTPAATETSPTSVAVDPTGRFTYVTNQASGTVSVYTINQSTGALTAGTAVATGWNPWSVAVDPTGKFVYVASGSSNDVSVYTINQSTGALTAVDTTVVMGSSPNSVAVDPTGRFVYVGNNGSNNVSVYAIDALTRVSEGTLTAYIGGGTSLWNGGTTPVTMIGTYDPVSPSAFVWGQTIAGYNYITGQNVTLDAPPNAYAGFLTGYKASDDTMKAKWASVYVKDDGSAGIHLGTLTGTAYSGISMFKMDGTIDAPVEIVSSGIGITPADLYPANVDAGSLSNGTPVLTGGVFGGGGTIKSSYYKRESLSITGQDWGVWRSVSSGTYDGTTSASWSLSADHKYFSWTQIMGSELTGTLWSGSKLEGTTAGYGADINTGKTWISVGETVGTYDPVVLTYQAISAGLWIEASKFLWMVDNQPSKLQALNVPCVEVGVDNLSYSAAGMTNINMNSVKFFAPTSGGKPQVWATGNVNANWSTGYQPTVNTTYNLTGTAVNAQFTLKQFNNNVDNSKWLATVTNGSGQINGYAITFRGAAAGTTNATARTFSGTGAGVVK
ncbi:MAG: beta-propeller fold lactonase family protein [Syntrophorhabdaceae bacterium]|nr:beta-propeller fold lactonase family protein [Syntrophorhabdaceae bacterium]